VKGPDPLEALALQADTLGAAPPDAGAPGAPGADAPPLESPNLALIALALTAFREASCLMLNVQSPRATLTDTAIRDCASAIAPVADKYGLNLGVQFGPEATAAFVAGPILWNAWSQLSLELKARQAKPVGDAPPDPSSASSTAPAAGS
jgi:hypothetical protein